ncbi:MAG: hypothetical protein EHM61_27725 [Acidobacteria bacterium]|nr:MAG: hypothetical protein EHM61_27725 [Acidobacteriota bacterium]
MSIKKVFGILFLGFFLSCNCLVFAQLDCGIPNGPAPIPFTDANYGAFCSAIAQAYFTGLTNGTSPTTYGPTALVDRGMMAAFITRTMNQSLKRGSHRAAMGQWWTMRDLDGLALYGSTGTWGMPLTVATDGRNVWAGCTGGIGRLDVGTGTVLNYYTVSGDVSGIVPVPQGTIFVAGTAVYRLTPNGTAPQQAASLSGTGKGIAFDGSRYWVTTSPVSGSGAGSLYVFTQTSPLLSWSGTLVAILQNPTSVLFDGTYIWVADPGAHRVHQFDTAGNPLWSAMCTGNPGDMVFDGTNLWVPDSANTVLVIRPGASGSTVIASLSGNGLNRPRSAAFDGERILVTNMSSPPCVSLFRAADLSSLGTATGTSFEPFYACSDGVNFWLLGETSWSGGIMTIYFASVGRF